MKEMMYPLRFFPLILVSLLLASPDVVLVSGQSTTGGCNNNPNPRLAFIINWVNGNEKGKIIGQEASFGSPPPKDASEAQKRSAVLANPLNCCVSSSSKFADSIVLAMRGECTYTDKAKIAEAGGAAGLLVINENEYIPEMVCSENDSSLNIKIPTLMISKSEGETLKKPLESGERVDLLLYSPDKPLLEFSVFFLWVMAISTVVISSLWAGADVSNQDPSDFGNKNEDCDDEAVIIKASGAIVFIITSSTVLLVLYFTMSDEVIWLLIAIFCIGGSAGVHTCLVALILRVFRSLEEFAVDLPIFGDTTILSIVLLPICFGIGIFWAVHKHESYAWILQDILGMCLIISGLRVVKLPNIKVATALLSAAFCYDVFWVFISPLIFQKSVMVEVARGGKSGGGDSVPMVLTIPRFFDPWGGTGILGFGDIMIPGLLIAFCYRFDKIMKKGILNGYFLLMLVGYSLGFALTYLSLYLMRGKGQPALLYLVPCTLGLVIIVGSIRREMDVLWSGPEEAHFSSEDEA